MTVLAVSLPLSTVRNLVYLIAIIGFILALKGLGSPKYARRGNQIGAASAKSSPICSATSRPRPSSTSATTTRAPSAASSAAVA